MCGFILVLLFSLSQGKGEYGTEITKIARPLPLEYLIVELTTTTPRRPKPTLPGGRGTPFPIENRDQFGEIQVTNHYWTPGLIQYICFCKILLVMLKSIILALFVKYMYKPFYFSYRYLNNYVLTFCYCRVLTVLLNILNKKRVATFFAYHQNSTSCTFYILLMSSRYRYNNAYVVTYTGSVTMCLL